MRFSSSSKYTDFVCKGRHRESFNSRCIFQSSANTWIAGTQRAMAVWERGTTQLLRDFPGIRGDHNFPRLGAVWDMGTSQNLRHVANCLWTCCNTVPDPWTGNWKGLRSSVIRFSLIVTLLWQAHRDRRSRHWCCVCNQGTILVNPSGNSANLFEIIWYYHIQSNMDHAYVMLE